MINFIEFLRQRSTMGKKKYHKLTHFFKSNKNCQTLHLKYNGKRQVKDEDGELILHEEKLMSLGKIKVAHD